MHEQIQLIHSIKAHFAQNLKLQNIRKLLTVLTRLHDIASPVTARQQSQKHTQTNNESRVLGVGVFKESTIL